MLEFGGVGGGVERVGGVETNGTGGGVRDRGGRRWCLRAGGGG